MITQQELKELFSYSEETGLFTRLVRISRRGKTGDIAGCVGSNGYVNIGIKKKYYFAHRLAWLYFYGEFPKKNIDHINGNPTDNRISNLREATFEENSRNVGITKRNNSGFKGVYFVKKRKKWASRCSLNKKEVYLGSFNTAEDAAKAYQEFAIKHHGEFARF